MRPHRIAALVLALGLAGLPALAQEESVPPSEDVPSDTEAPPPPKPPAQLPPAEPQAAQVTGVILQGLDKVTARISTIEVPIDGSVQFGTLVIRARTCKVPPPDEPPDAAAFLEITDSPPDQQPQVIFSGWMFASSPALSALEHPVYDVWVNACKTTAPPAP